MKTKFFIHSLLVIGMISGLQNSYSNPFQTGTSNKKIQQSVLDDLSVGDELNDQHLLEAIQAGSKQHSERAVETYVDVAKEYVIALGAKRKRLVSVWSINQGLELVHGIPQIDGQGIAVPALVSIDLNPDLRAMILKESLQMAYDLAKRNQTRKDFSSIEWEELATLRLARGKTWAEAALDLQPRYQILHGVLSQWVSLLINSDFQYPESWSLALVESQRKLSQCPKTLSSNEKIRECQDKILKFMDQILRSSKFPASAQRLGSYESQQSGFFTSLDHWKMIAELKDAALRLQNDRRLSTAVVSELSQTMWKHTKSLANSSLSDAQKAELISHLFYPECYNLNLQAAYVLAIIGTPEERKQIAQRGQELSSNSAMRHFLQISNNPNLAKEYISMVR